MSLNNILIVVKTYPEISTKYKETVCTAGLLKETKTFVRLYPVRFRYLEKQHQFSKYQWIKAEIHKAVSDPRPESYTISEQSMELGPVIEPGIDWSERAKWILNPHTVFDSVETLLVAQKKSKTSLGLVKPARLIAGSIEEKPEREIEPAAAKKKTILSQTDLWEPNKDLELLPIRIYLQFSCASESCSGHKMTVLDWEFGELYRKMAHKQNWKSKIEGKIRDIFKPSNETYLILGNMANHQNVFCVLGFFYPPKHRQELLF